MTTDEEYSRHQRSNRAAEIARSEGFDCFDFTREIEEIGLDYNTDFFDKHHLLASGQQKLSDYIGKTIKEKYAITPKRQSEKNKSEWEDSADMIKRFYKCYDDYIKTHAAEPLEEVDHDLSDTVRTIKELESVTP